MEERIETTVSSEKVWSSWERAHERQTEAKMTSGQKGVAKGFKYQVLDVIPGQYFSILWKTAFVRLVFSHSVASTRWGSEIRYDVKIKGLFAWPVRWLLGKKIRQNIGLVLKAIVKQLEEESIIEAKNRRRS